MTTVLDAPRTVKLCVQKLQAHIFQGYAGIQMWIGERWDGRWHRGPIIVPSLGPPNTLIRHWWQYVPAHGNDVCEVIYSTFDIWQIYTTDRARQTQEALLREQTIFPLPVLRKTPPVHYGLSLGRKLNASRCSKVFASAILDYVGPTSRNFLVGWKVCPRQCGFVNWNRGSHVLHCGSKKRANFGGL